MSRTSRGLLLGCFALTLWGAFSPGWGWLAWLAPAPFFLALKGTGGKAGFLWGFLAGFIFFLAELSPVLALRAFLGALAIPAWLLLATYGALFFSVLGGVVGRWDSPILWAGAWTLLEAARAAGPLGFSFGALPLSFVGGPFLPAAAWGGPLLSLAAAWTGAWLAKGLLRPRRLWPALVGPLALAGLALLSPQPELEGELRVALVQPNFSQEEKLERGNLPRLLATYRQLLSDIQGPLDLVVVPENALPAYLREEPQYLEPFREAARRLSCDLLVGSGDRREGRVYNSVLLLSPTGEVEGVYDMVHLVPFGEYLPGRRLWEALGLGSLLSRLLPFDLAAGTCPLPLGPYGVMICFESQFSGLSRWLVRGGAQVLVALTNDAWFGRTRFLGEHFAMGALRAAECGRAFIQAAQTGVSGGFDGTGEFISSLPPWEEGVLSLKVPLYRGESPLVRWGPGPALGLAGLAAVLGMGRGGRPRRREAAGPGGNA